LKAAQQVSLNCSKVCDHEALSNLWALKQLDEGVKALDDLDFVMTDVNAYLVLCYPVVLWEQSHDFGELFTPALDDIYILVESHLLTSGISFQVLVVRLHTSNSLFNNAFEYRWNRRRWIILFIELEFTHKKEAACIQILVLFLVDASLDNQEQSCEVLLRFQKANLWFITSRH